MMNHIKYAISRYSFWLSVFATVIGIVAIAPICDCIAIFSVILCFVLPFIILPDILYYMFLYYPIFCIIRYCSDHSDLFLFFFQGTALYKVFFTV